jgi:alcohol dehydrogenase class IV
LLVLDSAGKVGFLSRFLLPTAAVCDPEFTMTCPPGLTAACGMDALAHCVEALCSVRFNPVADAIALDGFSRGVTNIVTAVEDGTRAGARRETMLAALEGNAIFLPHVVRFNHAACAEKVDQLAARMDVAKGTDVPDALARLNERLGLPGRLRDLGVAQEDVEPLAETAWRDHCIPTNPRPLDVAACLALYRAAW